MWAERRLAMFFGCMGLVPFFAGTALLWLMPSQSALILKLYFLFSAGVLAFMGGVYWPISMQLNHCTYPVSPMTAILLSQAFFILAGIGLLLPIGFRPLLFMVVYGLLYMTDRTLLRGFWPEWYMDLRLLLTVAVIGTQFAVAAYLWA